MQKDLVTQNAPTLGTVVSGYEAWINEPARAASGEVSFGAWWRSDGAYWNVLWIEDTGELCAVELGETDRFVFMGNFLKKEINETMRRWFDGDNLTLLIQRFSAAAGNAAPQ
jgi:hypothetical protein